MPNHILVVEDNDAVALGLVYALQKEGFAVTRAATAAEGLHHAPASDLITLDVRLPDGNGFDLCRALRAAGARQPILMLTARDETIDKIVGLEIGADDYMTKPYELRELIARIRALLRRSYGPLAGSGSAETLTVGDLVIDLAAQRVRRGDDELSLTATEFRLLTFLARHPNKAHSRDALIDAVWGYEEYVGDPRTVDVHIRNLRQKVEADPAEPQRIVTVRGAGYMLVA